MVLRAEEEERDSQEDIDASDSGATVTKFVRERESNPVVQQQLIKVIHNTWVIPGSRTIFESGALSKFARIGRRPIIPEKRLFRLIYRFSRRFMTCSRGITLSG
ncbi:hypothetical protein H5410_030287 [Solanum commersonii]|uniref:Uncharacterized protein n=1 Tax=Solanum commersonii TaxID=4109 RepID=A0A9J5YFQ7_SOLCO|nr:hypothetical protein H5410_030287 [Solanum commersonii]